MWKKGKFAQAEEHCRNAMTIRKQALGDGHPDVSDSVNILGVMMHRQRRIFEAEEYFRRALATRKEALGDLGCDHPDVAASLNDFGCLMYDLDRYSESAECDSRALAIRKKALGAEPPSVALSLNNLGRCCSFWVVPGCRVFPSSEAQGQHVP